MAHRGNGCLKHSCGVTAGNASTPTPFPDEKRRCTRISGTRLQSVAFERSGV